MTFLKSFVIFTGLSVFILSLGMNASFAGAAVKPVEQVFHLGNGAEPKDLDPHVATGVPEHHILQNLFEPLVSKDPKTLEAVPGVAESWKLSKDGKVYTFKLRKNAKWSNGEPVTAQDFIYSWTRLLEPSIASEYAYALVIKIVKNGDLK
jgi:oligopeptide transport system substrate-binding protein